MNSMDGTFKAAVEGLAAGGSPEGKLARTLFAADAGAAAALPGRDAGASLLAELILHQDVETPFCIGLFGAPGAGKTRLLDGVTAAAERLAAAATEAGLATPFVADLLVVRVDGGREGDAAALLGGAVFDRLAATAPGSPPTCVTRAPTRRRRPA